MSKTILVVEDSPTETKLILSTLTPKGYNIVTASDGEQALEQAARHHPDVVLLDIVLPKLNGYQVCRAIKSSTESANAKVIMVSSKNQEADKFWGLKQGADEYLTKPIDTDELLQVVERSL